MEHPMEKKVQDDMESGEIIGCVGVTFYLAGCVSGEWRKNSSSHPYPNPNSSGFHFSIAY